MIKTAMLFLLSLGSVSPEVLSDPYRFYVKDAKEPMCNDKSHNLLNSGDKAHVSLKREIKRLKDKEYEIHITIYKNKLAGFGAYYETISDSTSFIASILQHGGGSFQQSTTGVKGNPDFV
jgi:hypothetical protein